MYICMCHVITRKAIESAIEGGARTVEEVGERTTAGTDCGKCRRGISRLLDFQAQVAADTSASLAGAGAAGRRPS